MASTNGTLRIGTSGWQYDHWKSVFYPENLAKKDWFAYYASQFDCVEINNTFYNLPKPETFDDWKDAAPKGFQYVLKFSRYGSHMKKLKDPADSIKKFLHVAERLKSTLGPVLVQLPPHWGVDVDRLDAFLKAAPRRHRWAIELRDETWLCPETYETLRKHNAALVIHDMIPEHPKEITADFVYLRFHGPAGSPKYSGAYSPQYLTARAKEISAWLTQRRDVYAFFNNDEQGHAVKNARQLSKYLE